MRSRRPLRGEGEKAPPRPPAPSVYHAYRFRLCHIQWDGRVITTGGATPALRRPRIRKCRAAAMRIRTFTPADRAALQALFRVAGQGAPTESLWGHAASEAAVYLDPYMDRAPDSLLLAESGGAPVGYLTGCLDSAAFPGEAARMAAAIRRHRLFAKPACARFFARGLADTAGAALARRATAGGLDDARWPSHLH